MCVVRESSYSSFRLIFSSLPLTLYSFTPYSVIVCLPSYLQIRIQTKGNEKKKERKTKCKKKRETWCVTLEHPRLCSWYRLGFTASYAKGRSHPWSLQPDRIIRRGLAARFQFPDRRRPGVLTSCSSCVCRVRAYGVVYKVTEQFMSVTLAAGW